MSAEDLFDLHRSQERVLGQLERAHVAGEAADRERDRLVGEARRLAVTWERIGERVGMARRIARRRWQP